MSRYNFVIPASLQGQRIDKALFMLCQDPLQECREITSRNQMQKAIKKGVLLINNNAAISNLSYIVKENDQITLTIIKEPITHIVATNIPLDIVYEDQDLIVINKPCNMTTHPGAGNHTDTLVNALLHHGKTLSNIAGEVRPGIVHRLDKDTSGLMVVAKNNLTHKALATQIETRTLKRQYKALVWGMMNPQNGIINIPIDRNKSDRTKMTTVKSGGRAAVTHYKTLEIFKGGLFSLVQCNLETGRTHQIRVHLSHMGHSIVGDQTYGNNKRKILGCSEELQDKLMNFDHQALHSFYIGFTHPISGEFMEFEKDLPEDYNNLVVLLREKDITK